MGFGLVSFWEKLDFEGGPPSPMDPLTGAALQRRPGKILSAKEFDVKSFLATAVCTASALTMI